MIACPACNKEYKNSQRTSIACVCGQRFKTDGSTVVSDKEGSTIVPQLPCPPGPGTEFLSITRQLRLKSDCSKCAALRMEMDALGVQGCEKDRERLLTKLKENAAQFGWMETITAGAMAVALGLPKTLEGLLDLAIERAAANLPLAKELAKSKSPRFVSILERTIATHKLASKIPSDCSGIVGVSRSGVSPAGLLAELLHLPLSIFDGERIMSAGHGWRFDGGNKSGPLVVVDDTLATGRSLKKTRATLHGYGEDLLYAVVYRNPECSVPVDLWAEDLPQPHLLEWNLFNSLYTPELAFDLDGVLCCEESGGPLYPVRRGSVNLIVTGRHERHRDSTLAWLARHDIKCSRLEMLPDNQEQTVTTCAMHKARHFGESFFAAYVESCPEQARIIAKSTGKMVICPRVGVIA